MDGCKLGTLLTLEEALSAEETDFLMKCSLLLACAHIKEPNTLQMCHLLTPMVNRRWKDTNIINVAISNS